MLPYFGILHIVLLPPSPQPRNFEHTLENVAIVMAEGMCPIVRKEYRHIGRDNLRTVSPVYDRYWNEHRIR